MQPLSNINMYNQPATIRTPLKAKCVNTFDSSACTPSPFKAIMNPLLSQSENVEDPGQHFMLTQSNVKKYKKNASKTPKRILSTTKLKRKTEEFRSILGEISNTFTPFAESSLKRNNNVLETFVDVNSMTPLKMDIKEGNLDLCHLKIVGTEAERVTPMKKSILRRSLSRRNEIANESKVRSPGLLNNSRTLGLRKVICKTNKRRSKDLCNISFFTGSYWKRKQENAYTDWINHVFSVDDVIRARCQFSQDTNSILFKSGVLRMRTRMWKLFSSDGEFKRRLRKIENHVDSGKLSLRRNGAIIKDVRIRTKAIEALMNYNPTWLQIGVETVLGLQDVKEEYKNLHEFKDLLKEKFLNSKGLMHDSQCEYFSKLVLKRFLVLVALLDESITKLKLECMPPLLLSGIGRPKSSADLLQVFLCDAIKGEGDIMRHLRFMGYKLKYHQNPIDEYDFQVKNIAVDLRDGIRLSKMTEILVPGSNIMDHVTVPAEVRSIKVKNTELALQALRSTVDHFGTLSNIKGIDLVNGNREQTLGLIWTLIVQFQIPSVVAESDLISEIEFLSHGKDKERRTSIPFCVSTHSSLTIKLFKWVKLISEFYGLKIKDLSSSFADGRALCYLISYYLPSMLPESCIYVEPDKEASDNEDFLATKESLHERGVKRNFEIVAEKSALLGGVPNFLSVIQSTLDERCVISFISFLCSRLLDIRHENAAAIKIQKVWRNKTKNNSKNSYRNDAAIKLQAAIRGFALRRSFRRKIEAIIKLQSAVRMFLTRKHLKHMNDAATIIQAMFRAYLVRIHLHRNFIAPQILAKGEERALLLKESRWTSKVHKPVVKIQSYVRAWIMSRRFKYQRFACIRIQAAFRAAILRKKYRIMRSSAITIQANFRKYVKLQNYSTIVRSIRKIQRGVRAYHQRLKYKSMRDACITIQKHVRGYNIRNKYLKTKLAATVIQKAFRKLQNARSAEELRMAKRQYMAACKIQCTWRAHQERQRFNHKKRAVITIQCAVRGHLVRLRYLKLQNAATTIQSAYRRRLAMKVASKLRFLRIRNLAVVKIQRGVRAYHQRLKYKSMRDACITIQKHVRGYNIRNKYLKTKLAATVIQKAFRKLQNARSAEELRMAKRQYMAACKIQCTWRAHQERQRFNHKKRAVITIQCAVRGHLVRLRYLKLQNAATTIQSAYRRRLAMKVASKLRFLRIRNLAVVKIQRGVRAYHQRLKYKSMRDACITIQKHVRGYNIRNKYLKTTLAATVIQKAFRKLQNVRSAEELRMAKRQYMAACKIQCTWRAHQERQRFNHKKRAIITIQCAVRGHLVRLRYLKLQNAATTIQSAYRRRLAMRLMFVERRRGTSAFLIQKAFRNFLIKKNYQKELSTLRIQKAWRGYLVRRKASIRMRNIRIRFEIAAELGKQHPELQIGNRSKVAISTLMESKQLTEAIQGCAILKQSTSYSHIICELLVSNNAISKLFRFMRSCNRSKPHMELLCNILEILNNISCYHWLVDSIHSVPGSTTILVEQLQNFRDKRQPFTLCINILRRMIENGKRRNLCSDISEISRRISLILDYLSRKAVMEKKCIVHAKSNTSVAFLVECKQKYKDAVIQIDALSGIFKMLPPRLEGIAMLE